MTYLEVFELARRELDLVVWDVDQEVAVSHADTAIAAHDFGAFVIQRRGSDSVCESTTVAGCLVCLVRCLVFGHVDLRLFSIER